MHACASNSNYEGAFLRSAALGCTTQRRAVLRNDVNSSISKPPPWFLVLAKLSVHRLADANIELALLGACLPLRVVS